MRDQQRVRSDLLFSLTFALHTLANKTLIDAPEGKVAVVLVILHTVLVEAQKKTGNATTGHLVPNVSETARGSTCPDIGASQTRNNNFSVLM